MGGLTGGLIGGLTGGLTRGGLTGLTGLTLSAVKRNTKHKLAKSSLVPTNAYIMFNSKEKEACKGEGLTGQGLREQRILTNS